MKKIVLLILTSLVSSHLAAMEALTDSDMQQVEGQAGADLSLKLVLNQINASDSYYTTNNAYKFDNGTGGICEKLQFCHLALSVNNRPLFEVLLHIYWLLNNHTGLPLHPMSFP